jgi:hypothetical protein
MSTWTPEAIRALGVRTDLPTLGKIFGISRARAYQMAQTGEWEQAGIRIVPLGGKYVVVVQSILAVLGHGSAGPVPETASPATSRCGQPGTRQATRSPERPARCRHGTSDEPRPGARDLQDGSSPGQPAVPLNATVPPRPPAAQTRARDR